LLYCLRNVGLLWNTQKCLRSRSISIQHRRQATRDLASLSTFDRWRVGRIPNNHSTTFIRVREISTVPHHARLYRGIGYRGGGIFIGRFLKDEVRTHAYHCRLETPHTSLVSARLRDGDDARASAGAIGLAVCYKDPGRPTLQLSVSRASVYIYSWDAKRSPSHILWILFIWNVCVSRKPSQIRILDGRIRRRKFQLPTVPGWRCYHFPPRGKFKHRRRDGEHSAGGLSRPVLEVCFGKTEQPNIKACLVFPHS
jgi:hypothetical protein